MFRTVLIANRGEIAVRIIRTCRALGIRTVAVYSEADAQALHVLEADQALPIGPGPATASYLNAAAVLEAAHIAGAEAIHPGYGFLSENPDFAQACLDAGLVWVGPSPAAMRALGDKAHARALAEACGVPLLAGYHADDQSPERLAREAERIGYPVLVKASAGGGGRGMRVVEAPAGFVGALEAAKREALSSFGNDRVLLERYMRRPRHVEVQVVGDQHGHLVHLGERECSIQRRYQKLIEESPSPAVDADLRRRMGEAALALARAAGYANAGTVEFLLDEGGQFAFLEVNARLQVEHPVTEALTGLDLVELQLRIAAGEPLLISQEQVRWDGHALEVRVVAEDPLSGWAPSSGRVERFSAPRTVRVDTWLRDGASVSPYYDSLLAKLIAHGPGRDEAVERMIGALRAADIVGVAHNLDLLLACLEEPAFRAGQLHTGFLEEHDLVEGLADVPAEVLAAASAASATRSAPAARETADPWRSAGAWRIGRIDQPSVWSRAGRVHRASVARDLVDAGLLVEADGRQVRAQVLGQTPDGDVRLSIDGQPARAVWLDDDRCVVDWQQRSFRLHRPPPLSVEQATAGHSRLSARGRLSAPMPGRIVKLEVEVGQQVEPNQPLVVLEAMKMEHVVEAPHAGVVREVCVAVGDQVTAGAVLIDLGETAPADADAEGP